MAFNFPWPFGNKTVRFKIGGHLVASQTARIIEAFRTPFDCYVRRVDRFLETQGGSFPTDVTVRTQGTDLQLVADLAQGQAFAGTQQTLHADIINVLIPRDTRINLKATTGSGDVANVYDTIFLEPATKL